MKWDVESIIKEDDEKQGGLGGREDKEFSFRDSNVEDQHRGNKFGSVMFEKGWIDNSGDS